MKRFARIVLATCLLLATLVRAQSPGVPVVLVLKKGGSSEALLVGKTDTSLRLQPKGTTAGEYQLLFDQVTEVRFVFPETISQAQDALAQSQWDRAAAILKPIAAPLIPHLDVPNNNGVPLVMLLAETLRRANKLDDALAYYDRIRTLPRSMESLRGAIWAAYCHAALNRSEQAWKILQSTEPPKRESEVFAL